MCNLVRIMAATFTLQEVESTANDLVQVLSSKSPKQEQLEVVELWNSMAEMYLLYWLRQELCSNCLIFLYNQLFPGS